MAYSNSKGTDEPVHLRSLIGTFFILFAESLDIVEQIPWSRVCAHVQANVDICFSNTP